jgi:hypothetical protein
MNHSDLINRFILWFQKSSKYKSWLIFKNNTGFDREKKIHYGIPSIGGFDLFAFGEGRAEFFEGKTISYPRLSKEQKTFRNQMIKKGFKCWIVKECDEKGFNIIPAELYKPYCLWPY